LGTSFFGDSPLSKITVAVIAKKMNICGHEGYCTQLSGSRSVASTGSAGMSTIYGASVLLGPRVAYGCRGRGSALSPESGKPKKGPRQLGVVNFEQISRDRQLPSVTGLASRRMEHMAILKNKKHKEYARYAAHCLEMVTATKDQETRAIQREMAAEWLRLADAVLRSSKSSQMQII
jgi:hypothetical protein